jgi:hypothetical protein
MTPADATNRGTTGGSRTTADPSLVTEGKVRTAAGKTAAGTQVALYAWPSNDVTDKMAIGDEVNLQQVSETTTSSTGSFALKINDLNILEPLAGTDRIINFEIVAGDEAGVVSFSLPRKLITTSAGKTLVDATYDPTSSRPQPLSFLTLDMVNRQVKDLTPTNTATKDPEAVEVPGQTGFAKACGSMLIGNYGLRWVTVGQHYNNTSQVWTDFLYMRSATSSLGVGVSYDGAKFGTFSSSGTVAKSSTLSIDYPAVGNYQSRYRDTQFKYGQYRIGCTSSGGVPYTYYQARPNGFAGGATSYSPGRGPAKTAAFCTLYQAGSTVTVERSKAVTWNNGVEISAALGIDLSSVTGYSAGAQLRYTFNYGRELCGEKDVPAGNPSQLSTW